MATTTKPDRTATAETVHRALHATRGVTAVAVQKATSLPYSTVTETLRKLAAAGRAVKRNGFWTKVGPSARLKATDVSTPRAEPAKKTRAVKTAPAAAPEPVPPTPDEDAVRILREAGDLTEPAPKRGRKAAADRPPVAAFGRGELRDAVIGYLQNMPDGVTVTAGDIARQLNAHTAPVGTNLVRMVKAGTVVQIFGEGSGEPARFRAA